MNRINKTLVVVATCGQLAIGTTASAATYVFGGHGSPTNSGAGNILNYVDRHAPLTFEFTTASPLQANLPLTSLLLLPISWTASGGSLASTISSTDTNAHLTTFQLSTDADGNIVRYNIDAHATNAQLPSKQWDFTYGNYDPGNVFERVELDTLQFNGVVHYTTLDSALICTNSCGGSATPGRFQRSDDVAPLPEPATWSMMLLGFIGLGVSLRRQESGRLARLT